MQEPQYRDEHPGAPGGEESSSAEKDSFLSFLGELPVLVITAIIVAWLIKTFLVQPFFIPSSSMEPTLLPGDRVLVSKLSYRLGEPKPGNIIVFVAPDAPANAEQDLIKRIQAVSGMTLEVKNGKLIVNGRPKEEPYIRPDTPTSSFGPVTVPQGKVFMMGDNRANSRDSRFFGPVDKAEVIGKAFFVYWPPGRVGMLK